MSKRDRRPVDGERTTPPSPDAGGQAASPPVAEPVAANTGDVGDGAEIGVAGEAPNEAEGRSSTDAPDAASSAADAPVAAADVEALLAEQRDKYLRLAAEYDNFRKRTNRERLEGGSRAQADLVGRMIDALDDLSRFAHIDPATTDPLTLHKGIELVEQKLLKVLAAAGLEVINPVDQTFDPTQHEAVATEAALSAEDDHTVAKVFQPGYRFAGQLLRPARVVVKQWNG